MIQQLLSFLQNLSWLNADAGLGPRLLFIAIVIASQVLVLPISPFDIAAGFAFGMGPGFFLMIAAKFISSLLGGILARTIAKDFANRLAQRFSLLSGLDVALAKGGWKLATLCRLCPIPFGAANYLFGLTKLPHLHHAMATSIAVIIPTLVFTSVGASAQKSLKGLQGDATPGGIWSNVFLGVGILAAVFVFRYVSKVALTSVQTAQAAETSVPQRPAQEKTASE